MIQATCNKSLYTVTALRCVSPPAQKNDLYDPRSVQTCQFLLPPAAGRLSCRQLVIAKSQPSGDCLFLSWPELHMQSFLLRDTAMLCNACMPFTGLCPYGMVKWRDKIIFICKRATTHVIQYISICASLSYHAIAMSRVCTSCTLCLSCWCLWLCHAGLNSLAAICCSGQ